MKKTENKTNKWRVQFGKKQPKQKNIKNLVILNKRLQLR